ncbi:helicase associated domain-containing protein [Actinacidiphila oryziradicis]|uniref:helicase associated domain-containing protein n=1 Tax=Actinacidiphila oryziradicis TaxID=2571141 RepID=UPI0023F283B8|nr:helicase associated domain-containing protein [Actinacidiphila oryziradicis]MCW2868887.1 helicase [Actinacidiphila oryziradicis]
MVAEWVSFNLIGTEGQDWARGYAAARKYAQREGHLRVPFDHEEGPARDTVQPLGHWISEQRKASGRAPWTAPA